MKRKYIFNGPGYILSVLLISGFLLTCAHNTANVPAPAPVPDRIYGYFFYDELCELCNEDETRFISILNERIPAAEREKYPHSMMTLNVYKRDDRSVFMQITNEMGLDRDNLTFPFLILGGRVFQGFNSINTNIREAFLTAAEDIFVHQRPYNPRYRKTGANLFDDYTVNPDNVTMVYFYRIVCPQCVEIEPYIDGLPATVMVNGRQRTLDIIRINTRSGNNNERIAAFFEAWQVPDSDRVVPIIFLSDSYLSGVNAITDGLEEALSRTPIPWKLLN